MSVRIALLGATSHIAKGLIACWSSDQEKELYLYARSPERVREFLASAALPDTNVFPIDQFGAVPYDIVINCTGFGGPQRLKENLGKIFSVTARFDDAVLEYLLRYPHTLYVNMSSGAVYGSDFSKPVDEHRSARFNINSLSPEEYYGIAKLHAEARHRSLPNLNIVDVRIFGFFSRYIDLNEGFLLSGILSCLKTKQTFLTGPADIWRDFIHPGDLATLIGCCYRNRPLNAAYDAYSTMEVGKFELLTFFAENYGLEYRVDEAFQSPAVTGQKDYYYPVGRLAGKIGYEPVHSSLEGIHKEMPALLRSWECAGGSCML